MTSTDKLIDILEMTNDIKDKPDAIELRDCTGDIEFENVSFAYDLLDQKSKEKQRQALKDVSFSIKAGQHVAIVGETGA
jgi:ABC-type multidrug transport system fused ATPase/permease subunit